MPSFRHDDVEIAFLDEGAGEPIVLVHGFASNAAVNWVQPGWVTYLTRAGRRVIALDNRGHGASTKLYDPAAYHSAAHGRGCGRALDHLELGRADVMGYSMGARIAAFLALAASAAACAAPSSAGWASASGRGRRLPADRRRCARGAFAADVSDPRARLFRAFAEQTKSDLRALAACIRGSRQTLTPAEVATIRSPALVAVGTQGRRRAAPPQELASLLPAGQALDIPGRDHMPAVGDKVFKARRAALPGRTALIRVCH